MENEDEYWSVVNALTAVPFQYQVMLDDIGLDYEKVSDYQLFCMLLPMYAQNPDSLKLVFGDIEWYDVAVYHNNQNDSEVLYSELAGATVFDEYSYMRFVKLLRELAHVKRCTTKAGNSHAKKYFLDKERKKQKQNANKKQEPTRYLEKLVIAMVNAPEFKYNYEECMNLTISTFFNSFDQIQKRINFNNVMQGVYAGTVDTSKMSDKSVLSWIPI